MKMIDHEFSNERTIMEKERIKLRCAIAGVPSLIAELTNTLEQTMENNESQSQQVI